MPFALPQLIKRLKRHAKPAGGFGPVKKKAAVAIPMATVGDEICILMIRRAKRAGDPWSGHMGFPGGRRDPSDRNELDCAIRETREELGFDLKEHGELVCELGEVNTGWRPDRPEMLVTPFVFTLHNIPIMTPNYEVDGVIWVPLDFLLDQGNRVPLKWEWRGEAVESDSYIYQGDQIWGLSLMMLDELMTATQR
jgi:8-oxo-dGTP pyrophosphatase MutT (NUDIX family)